MNENRARRASTIEWLKRSGLTQRSWAELLGVGEMTVYFWLKRRARPHGIYLDRIRERTPDCPILRERRVKEA